MTNDIQDSAIPDPDAGENPPSGLSEDIIAIMAGAVLLVLVLVSVLTLGSDYITEKGEPAIASPLKSFVGKPGEWSSNPMAAFVGTADKPKSAWLGTLGALVILGVLLSALAPLLRPMTSPKNFLAGYLILFFLATLSYVLAGQSVIKAWNLEFALWALVVGLIVGNTIGKEALGKFGAAAVRTELYIKTGLVLLGAEVLFNHLLKLGPAGVLISWVVTPVVLITTFWFGQKILKMASPSLNMVISADMSVCGVSAAIATAAACKAKKEELSVAIGLSLCFTAGMMVVMPWLANDLLGLGPVIGGAWIGGTIDATGAVAVAGAILGDTGLTVAATVKMIQNILIGVIAFGVAVYWTTRKDVDPETGAAPRIGAGEIWKRFPKFVLGFIVASILFSLLYGLSDYGAMVAEGTTSVTKSLRGWLFCLAFVCIGIDMNFRQLAHQFHGGKPLVLYICGQTLNLILTLAMAMLVFKVLFPETASALLTD